MKSLIFSLLLILPLYSGAQEKNPLRENEVGPKGTDTASYSKIYIIRDSDFQSTYWFGVWIENYNGLLVKVFQGSCYKIYFPAIGKQVFFTQTEHSGKWEVKLDLKKGTNYYLKMSASGTLFKPFVKLEEIDSIKGREIISKYGSRVQARYSQLILENSGFITDKYRNEKNPNEKLHNPHKFYLDDSHSLYANLPSQLVAYFSVSGDDVFYFYSAPVSETYNESFFNIRRSKKVKFESKIDFEIYLKNSIKSFGPGKNKRYSDYKWEIIKLNDHAMGGYNALIYAEYHDNEAVNKWTEPYLIFRKIYRIYSWVDSKGKMRVCALNLSECGKESELSNKEELIKKFEVIDKSLKVQNNVE